MRTLIKTLMLTSLLVGCEAKTNPSDTNQLNEAKTQDNHSPDYKPQGLASKSVIELQTAMADGTASAEDIIKAYLKRIQLLDRNGEHLHSFITINPKAISQAKKLDELREAGKTLGALHGIPIAIKDNIETKGAMPTTAGSLALAQNITNRDAPLIAELKNHGAIIIGKTNLSEWANFRSPHSMSGWSALGGQVRNPHKLDFNPCGSSSGSAVAVAASFVPLAIGTETNGSIICPASINGIVGFKPSLGLVSQKNIIPISHSQDTAGPMARSVSGVALLLNGMVGSPHPDYLKSLGKDALKGVRVGVLRFSTGKNKDMLQRFDAAMQDLQKAGAELVEIDKFESKTQDFSKKSYLVLLSEFKAGLNEYLAKSPANIKVRSLAELIEFNRQNADTELALFGQEIFEEADKTNGVSDQSYQQALKDVQNAAGKQGIDMLLAKHNVAVLVAPSAPTPQPINPEKGDQWPEWVGAGHLAAIAGYPHLTVPMGEINALPVGLSFMGAKHDDAKILAFGYAYEQISQKRVEPKYQLSAKSVSNGLDDNKAKALHFGD